MKRNHEFSVGVFINLMVELFFVELSDKLEECQWFGMQCTLIYSNLHCTGPDLELVSKSVRLVTVSIHPGLGHDLVSVEVVLTTTPLQHSSDTVYLCVYLCILYYVTFQTPGARWLYSLQKAYICHMQSEICKKKKKIT